MSGERAGAALGVAAAVTFGLSAPAAKLLLPHAGPLMLAALLYLGAGIGLSMFALLRGSKNAAVEAGIRGGDLSLLGGVILTGGVLGPFLMLQGLSKLPAATTSLLLNLEAPFTIFMALLLFREHLGRRELGAAIVIVLGAVLLSYQPGVTVGSWRGLLAVAGACLSWAVDNNLTQRLSLRDPVTVVRYKTLAAGAAMLVLALLLGHSIPAPGAVASILAVGSISYGASVVLDMYALRLLGAAREAAYFATAPFVGALASAIFLRERLGAPQLAAGVLMAGGVVLLALSRHGHVHTHEALEHEHTHVHDEHHQHAHEGPVTEPHAHPHEHAPLTHDHGHVSDLHHRHRH